MSYNLINKLHLIQYENEDDCQQFDLILDLVSGDLVIE